MTVTLKLKNGLDRILNQNIFEIELSTGDTLLNILGKINFPQEKAGIILINGKLGNKNCLLHGGETVKVFPQSLASN